MFGQLMSNGCQEGICMFLQRLEALCYTRGITIPQACQMAGLHRSTPSTWKHGITPSDGTLVKLAAVLCTTVEYLRDGKELAVSDDTFAVEWQGAYVQQLLSEVARMDTAQRISLLQFAKRLNNCVEGDYPGI